MQPGKTHLVSCPCGADVRIDPLRPERTVVCPRCRTRLDFVVTIDPKSVKPRVSIVVPPQALRIQGESLAKKTRPVKPVAPPPPAPPPKTIRAILADCGCGASFPVDVSKVPGNQACPQCRAIYYVVVRTLPGMKKKEALLLPENPAAGKASSSAPRTRTGETRSGIQAVAPPSARAETVIAARKSGRTRLAVPAVKAPASKAPPQAPPGAQVAACPCGEAHLVRRRDLGRDVPCPGCGRTLRFEEVRDPQTLAPGIRVKLAE